MTLSKITTNSIADDAVTTAKMNPAQTDITSTGTLTSLNVSGDVSLDGGSFVFNESSADKDFRIESNGNANMLFVDGGNDVIGIKTATPTDYYADDLVITAPDEGGITIVSGTAERTYLAFADGTSGDARYRGLISYDHNTDIFGIGAGGGTKIELDSTSNLGVGRSINAHSGYTNVAIGGSGSTTGSMIELFDSDGNRDGKAYANAGDLYVAAESNNLYLNTNGTNGIRVENDGQVTISRFNEGAGNNHAHLTLSYNLSTAIGGFAMYTYSYYSDVNWRLTNNDTNGARNHNDMAFIRSGSTVGSVSVSTSGTSFNTSSDYRLKEDHKSITDAIGTVKQLKPINFKWKKTGVRQDGFIAHEVDEILDYVVSGKKDEVKTYENVVLNKDGYMIASDITKEKFEERIIDSDNEDQSPVGETTYPEGSTWKATHEDIDPQVMDNAKLVPILTAALQEAIARIEVLENK